MQWAAHPLRGKGRTSKEEPLILGGFVKHLGPTRAELKLSRGVFGPNRGTLRCDIRSQMKKKNREMCIFDTQNKEDRHCSATASSSSTYPVHCEYVSMPGGTVCIVRRNQKDISPGSCCYSPYHYCTRSDLCSANFTSLPVNLLKLALPRVYKTPTLLPVIDLLKSTSAP